MKPQNPADPKSSRPPIPETVGATAAPFRLGNTTTTIAFEIHPPTGPGLLRADGQPKRVLLRIENMRSGRQAPPYGMYLNLPPGAEAERHPDLFAFTLGTFGLVESSIMRDQHPGNGINVLEDITALYSRLASSREWDSKTLNVTFVPAHWEHPVDVEVGRLSLVLE